jgi:glycosyltransferase involved in cell wall biosynthesis
MTDAARAVVLVIPTLNEAASIGAVVQSIPRDVVGRIIVADGGSSDDTGECAQRSGAEVLDVGRGYGRACLLATQAATDAGIVVFMDGDGADDAQAIRSLVDPIRSGVADFVIDRACAACGSRGACPGIRWLRACWPASA